MIAATVLVVLIGSIVITIIYRKSGSTPVEEFSENASVEFVDSVTKLPHETDHYRVEFDDYYNQLVIVPKVDIDSDANPQAELERVWPTYEQYANEAVAWLKSENFDLKSFDVNFWQQDFWPTGKQITY